MHGMSHGRPHLPEVVEVVVAVARAAKSKQVAGVRLVAVICYHAIIPNDADDVAFYLG